MALLKCRYDKLHLKINESRSAVASALGCKFLGYALWEDQKGVLKRVVSEKALATFKQRIRELTRRSGGCSIGEVIERLRRYVLGWKAYVQLAQTPRRWQQLDEWMRRRMRVLHLKHGRRGKTMYRELLNLGAKPQTVQSVAALSRRWWHNRMTALHHVLRIGYFHRSILPAREMPLSIDQTPGHICPTSVY
jgi:RNA-directed DNA polymerase